MYYISASAVGFGLTTTELIQKAIDGKYPSLELAIGTKPDGECIDALKVAKQHGVSLLAHANIPLDTAYNQNSNFKDLIEFCSEFSIPRYSFHAPTKTQVKSFCEFKDYLKDKFTNANGLQISIETMYPSGNNFWMASYDSVSDVIEYASSIGWSKPIVADVAHLQICVKQGTWTDAQVKELLQSEHVSEFHYSDNNGVTDTHKPYMQGKNARIDDWLTYIPSDVDLVDEGRRKKYHQSF